MLTEDEFARFLHSKAYDVISNGNFRKHLMQCRDRGDVWALQMTANQARVNQECKAVQSLVSGMLNSPDNSWALICKDVMSSAQPPTKVLAGYTTCFFTGEKMDCCIDLTKNGKKSKEVHVHLRFWHFFIFLWFVAKLEYIVRACTKCWLEKSREPGEPNYTHLCERFVEDNREFTRNMYLVFLKSLDYVKKTVQLYKEEFQIQPVLKPDVWQDYPQNNDSNSARLGAPPYPPFSDENVLSRGDCQIDEEISGAILAGGGGDALAAQHSGV